MASLAIRMASITCTLGPLVSKIGWQEHMHWDTTHNNQDGRILWTKAQFMNQVGWSRTAQDFITLLRKASPIAQLVKYLSAMQETLVRFLGQEDLLEKGYLPSLVFLGFSCGSAGKESNCNVGHLGLTLGLGGSPGEGKGYPLQYSGLENSIDCIAYGVAKSWTRLNDFCFHSEWHNGYNGEQKTYDYCLPNPIY